MNLQRKKILSAVEAKDFIGRSAYTDALLRHARGENSPNGLFLLSAPALGASELLKQTYDRLFYEQDEIIPFYFALKKSDKTARAAAVRFLQDFLRQTVAFRRRDRKILDVSADICELAELALPGDGYWIDRLVAACQSDGKLNDEYAFLFSALSAPIRAAANGARSFVIIDDLHEAENLAGDIDFAAEFAEIYSRSTLNFVFASRRRFHPDKKTEDFETLEIEPLSFADAGLLVENLAEKSFRKINEQTRDLLAVQFGGNPTFIKFILQSAAENKADLDNFSEVQKIYADNIFGGRIAKYYDARFDEIAPNVETQKNILSLLYDAQTAEREKTRVESWQLRTGLNDALFYRAMRFLNLEEIIRVTSNLVEPMSENVVLKDYIEARFRLEVAAQNRALTVGETLSEFLKRAPRLMSEFYRRNSAIGLREILSVFDCQEAPRGLMDYSVFKDELKGAPKDEILKELKKDAEKIALPQIVYTAHTVAFYPPISQFIERERSAVALGFQECAYTDDDETVWIAAEIDSKLEASKDLTEFWCDRLEMVALVCNFLNYKIWLVAPEGFSSEASEILQSRNALGSSKKQIELLVDFLDAKDVLGEKLKPNEYEMVVPMGEDTELIAAQTVEEIARKHHFSPKAINQIKTALVEACINATEHSHSPDRKIYQKFTVEDDKIVITISNRGLRLSDKKAREFQPNEGRRGWGLKLMKNLMDEVKFEKTDDGTRISMTKYLK